jgi:hypothetical protein
MRYIKLLTGLFTFLLIVQSCSEDFLETAPLAMETEESYFSSMSAVEPSVIACYSQLSRMRTSDFNFVIGMGSIASDDAEAGGDGSAGDTPDIQALDRMTHTARDLTTIERIWGFYYKGIYFCNVALEKLPAIRETQSNNAANQALIDVRMAEVRFLRSLYYFFLSQAYGGVCKVTKPLNPDELSQTRVAINEIYDLIKSDLRAAIPVLPNKSGLGTDVGRATKGAAQALLAKVYLYESSYATNYPGDERFGDMEVAWDSALYFAEQVINSGEYKLVGIDGETFNTYWGEQTNGYRYAFTVDGDNCLESVFEIQNLNDDWIWVQSTGNALAAFTTARRYIDDNGSFVQFGWGFNCPSQELVDEFDTLDVRLKTTVARPGDTILASWQSGGVWLEDWFEIDFGISPTGYYSRKYEASPEQYWSTRLDWSKGPLNVRLIRFADVHLFAAEAAYMLNDQGKALEYVNQVRERARMCGGTGYTVPAPLASITFDDIIKERSLELGCEGHRFWDLVRWKIAEENLDGKQIAFDITISFESPKNDFFPLPASEVDYMNGELVQYEGW